MLSEAKLYPIFLKLEGRGVLVVGAGTVAEQKIHWLVSARARVRVVAPDATETIRAWADEGKVEWLRRTFEEADAHGAWLVIAATSDAAVQARAAAAAERLHVFVVAVDDPRHASAYSGAVVERAPFTVALSSSGATPALTRLLREMIEELLPAEDWVGEAKALRAKWLAEGTPVGGRFAELVKAFKHRGR